MATKDLGKRIGLAIGTEGAYAFAKRTGMSYSLLRRYVAGEVEPRSDKLNQIAAGTGVALDWLMTGKGAGPVNPVVHTPVPSGLQPLSVSAFRPEAAGLPREFLRDLDVAPEKAEFVVAPDDAMAPGIAKGDLVLLNTGERNITKGIQVIATTAEPLLRFVRFDDALGQWVLTATNPSFKTMVLSPRDMLQSHFFHGAVVAVMKRAEQTPTPPSSKK
jgi:transcriptional regulator with XRE-family HTH domain